MTAHRTSSIHRRLRLTMMAASSVALLAALLALVAYDIAYQRRQSLQNRTTLAGVLSANLLNSIEATDREAARDALHALRAMGDVIASAVYTRSGQRLASYMRGGDPDLAAPERPPPDGADFEGGSVLIVQGVHRHGVRIGTVYLRTDLSEARAIIGHHAGLMAIVMLGCVLVAYGMAALLQRAITGPMLGRIEHDDELRRQNQELLREKARFEASALAKSEFLANMSHEIRTPMTSILGYLDLLTDSEVSADERRDYRDTIRRNGQHLLDIINDILDLSKIEAGKMRIHRELCDLGGIVDDLVGLMAGRAREKGLEFILDYRTRVPETIETDATRLRQILINLLGNAVKFTSRGTVALQIELLARDESQAPQLRFDVSDTGIGLRYDQLATIFDPFAQADNSTTREFGGTGLGLAISQRLASNLGGGIAVESEEGRGSTFSLTIGVGSLEGVAIVEDPKDDLPARRQTDEATPAPGSGYVLLAEDGPDNQRLIVAFLRRGGYEVEVVANGRLAVETALAAEEEGEPFDLILMDMHMPELDGYGATARLRRAGYPRPIVALTAKAMQGNREECMAAGCDDYTTKPIDRQSLLKLVARYVEKGRSAP